MVPGSLLDKLRQGKVLIRNWHGLNWETEEKLARKKTVDKRGAKSAEAYVREVLGEIATARSLVVINDEAHHAWRIPAESKVKGVKKEEIEHVKDDLNRKAQEQEPLPQLVSVGYTLLGRDWLEAAKAWKERKLRTPPVMITVANRTETAARVNYVFARKRILIDELCDPEKILHIDSKVLKMAEAEEEPVSLNDDNPPEPEEEGGRRRAHPKALKEAGPGVESWTM